MCEPATIIAATSVAMSAYGAMQQSQALKDQGEYSAAVSRNNQIIAERNADEVEKQGRQEANRYRAGVRQAQADQMVSMASQGADVTFGSNVDLLADTAELGELDAKTIESNAGREAYNLRVQGMNYGAQAGLYDAQASAQSPLFSGVSTLLSGAGTVHDKWKSRPQKAN